MCVGGICVSMIQPHIFDTQTLPPKRHEGVMICVCVSCLLVVVSGTRGAGAWLAAVAAMHSSLAPSVHDWVND